MSLLRFTKINTSEFQKPYFHDFRSAVLNLYDKSRMALTVASRRSYGMAAITIVGVGGHSASAGRMP